MDPSSIPAPPDASPGETLAALERSRRQYQNLLNAVNGIVWEADAATMRFTFVSDKAERLIGYPARQWVDEPMFWVDHLHPDDREWAMNFCIEAAQERRDHELDYRMVAADGRIVWLREMVTVDTEDDGTVRLRGVMVDITRQKTFEAELQRRDAILEAVRFAGEHLLSATESWGDGVQQVLERLGRATDVSRVYIFENYTGPDGRPWATNTHEWVVSPELSVIELPQIKAMSYEDIGFGRWIDLFQRGEMVYNHVRELPKAEQAELVNQGILSIALVPIFVDGTWWGFVGFDECIRERTASRIERDALQSAANMLGAAIGRRRTDEELRENQRSMQTLLSNLPGMAYRISPDRNSSHPGTGIGPDVISEGALDLTGYTPSALAGGDGFSYTDIIHPDDRAAMRNDIDHAIQERQPYHLTYRITTAHGEEKWVMEQGRPVEDDSGEIVALEGIIMDVTERVRASEKLRENQRSMQTLLANLPGMAYRSTPGTPWRIEFVSEGAWGLTGYEPTALAGNDEFSFVDIIHPDDRGAIRHDIEAAIISGNPYHLTYRITTASGVEKWVMEQGRPVEDADATVVALEGIITDVTDRVEARRELECRVAERTRELSTLLQVSTSVASTLELKPLLSVILNQLKDVVDHVSAALYTLDDDEILRQLDYRGPTRQGEVKRIWNLADVPHAREVIEYRKPVIIPDVRADTPLARAYREMTVHDLGAIPEHVVSWMGVPLMLRDRAIGLLAVKSDQQGAYSARHAELALAFASHAAVAIENARLYEAAQGTAALQERQRLARELHDSVSQALFGIGLGARTAKTLIDQDPAKAIAPIDYVLSLAEAGLAEMRALIFELRPEALEEEGLVAALKKQVAALKARYGIDVEATLPEAIEIPQPVQEAIYRIAQEGLNNIVKHARATRVAVEVASNKGATTLCVSDNGIGFDTDGSFPGHLGLKTMSERATKLGGTFNVTSAPGKGSTIEVNIPSSDHKREPESSA